MKVNKQQAKEILQQLSPEELSLYKQLNAGLGDVNEAGVRSILQSISNNWKNYSTAMLMAIMMNSNMANAINNYSPETYKAINTELATDSISIPAPTISVPGSIKSVSFGENFDSGKATLTNKEDLVKKLSELKDWMKGKDIVNFKLVITAGESQVTNPKGFEKKGSLAQARAKTVEDVLSKMGFDKVDSQIKIGTESYDRTKDNKEAPKYKAEQFVTVDIVVDNDICTLSPATGKGQTGLATNNYVTYNKYISGKGELVLHSGEVPDRLVILDANGNVKEDTGYITTKVRGGDWKYTPLYVLELTKIYQAKSKAVAGSKIKTINVKDYDDLVAQLKKNPNQTNIAFTGNEIGPALMELQKLVNKGQHEFVVYDIGSTDARLSFDQSKGEVQAIVYSPIGTTDFGVTGKCTN